MIRRVSAANASRVQIADNQASFRTTADTFQRELHRYTATHANTPSDLRPRLRFPEFQKAGGWESKPLAELASLVGDRIQRTLLIRRV